MTKYHSSDDPLWPLLDRAIDESSPELLIKALGSARRHPALDHPIQFLTNDGDSSLARRAVTAHGLAVWKFFSATQSREPDMPERVKRAAELCRVLMRERAPLFSAAPGTGLEDDAGFGLQMFVRRVWPPAAQAQVEDLFHEYVAAGYFNFDAYIQPEDSGIIGGLLPFDAAIRLGNAPAAAAAVRAGCRTDNVATDAMGRSMDLVDYILKSAKQYPAETAASVAAALMDRVVGSRDLMEAPAEQAPTRRRRATV
jgi:hypothetical protein